MEIALLLAVAIIPLIIAISVSYVSSTNKAMKDAQESLTTLAGSANSLKDIAEQLNKEMEFFKS